MSKASIARTQSRLAQINGVAPSLITEAFTKQHYIAIARILADEKGQAPARRIALRLADMFGNDNSQFRREQFLDACGVEDSSND